MQEPLVRTYLSDEQLHVELRISADFTAPCDFWNQPSGSHRVYYRGELSGHHHELRPCLQFCHFLRCFLQAARITGADKAEAETDLQVRLPFAAKKTRIEKEHQPQLMAGNPSKNHGKQKSRCFATMILL